MTNNEQWDTAMWTVIKVVGTLSLGAILIVLVVAAAFYWARSGEKTNNEWMDRDHDTGHH